MGLIDRGDDPPAVGRDPGDLRRLRPALARRRARCSPSPTSDAASCSPSSSFDGPHWQAPRAPPRRRRGSVDAVRERGLEGIVAKRLGSPYRPGRRSREWLKVRNRRGQELVIGGWMPGEGGRGGRVGSLLVGYWDATPEEAERLGRPQRLVYAGGVGTGFTQAMLEASSPSCSSRCGARTRPFELGEDPRAQVRASAPASAAPARSGSSPSSSARSSSPSGPTRAPCASGVQGPARRQGPARGRARELEG